MISVSSGQTALESMGAVQGTVHLVARAVSAAGDEVRHEHIARPLPRTRTVVVSRGASGSHCVDARAHRPVISYQRRTIVATLTLTLALLLYTVRNGCLSVRRQAR